MPPPSLPYRRPGEPEDPVLARLERGLEQRAAANGTVPAPGRLTALAGAYDFHATLVQGAHARQAFEADYEANRYENMGVLEVDNLIHTGSPHSSDDEDDEDDYQEENNEREQELEGTVDLLEEQEKQQAEADFMEEQEASQPSTGDTVPVARLLQKSSAFPWMTETYKLTRENVGTTLATEKTCRMLAPYWDLFCKTQKNGRQAFTQGYGLSLFPDAVEGHFTTANEEEYDTKLVGEFFTWLLEHASPNTIKKAKTFINSHLRAEFYKRLEQANHHSPRLGSNIKVGKNTAVKNACKAAMGEQANRAMAEFQDIQANIDEHMDEYEIRGW